MPVGRSAQHWALVLAGGDGRRLQELTRTIAGAPIPKQYCRLLGEQSLLEATLIRARHFVAPDRTMVVVNHNHLDMARAQVATLPTSNVLIQPCNRDTGPGLLFALLSLARSHPTATVAVFPSDHYVDNDHAFIRHVDRAARIVTLHPDKIVLLGIQPDRPEPGFGYIVPSLPLGTCPETIGAFHVRGFWEKPSPQTTRELLAQKGLWNSFVMVFRLPRILELLARLMPSEFAQMQAIHADPDALVRQYPSLMRWNFSTQILARVPECLVVQRVDDVHWNDWGTLESIERTLQTLQRTPPWATATRLPTGGEPDEAPQWTA
jgi:mannose-1-phosphate guanylyltransferase